MIQLLRKRLAVFQLEKHNIRFMLVSRYWNATKVLLLKEYNVGENQTSDVILEIITDNKLSNTNIALLLPIYEFGISCINLPEEIDAKEEMEWIESHRQSLSDSCYDTTSEYFSCNHETIHQAVVTTVQNEILSRYIGYFREHARNLIYIGHGMESLGLGLADTPFFKEDIIAYISSASNEMFKCLVSNGFMLSCTPNNTNQHKGALSICTSENESIDVVTICEAKVGKNFAILYGLGLNLLLHIQKQCNQMPKLLNERNILYNAKRQFFRLCIQLSSIIAVILLINYMIKAAMPSNEEIMAIRKLQEKIHSLNNDLSILEKQQSDLTSLLHQKSKTSSYLEIIGKSVPKGILLSEITLHDNREGHDFTIGITGKSINESLLVNFVKSLTAYSYFTDVSITRIFVSDERIPTVKDESKGFEVIIKL
jgi:Tfp pilus assembly protein PilN